MSPDASGAAEGRAALLPPHRGTQSLWWLVLGTLAAWAWGLGILVGVLRLGLGYAALKRIRSSFRQCLEPRATELAHQAAAELGMVDAPPVFISPLVPIPISLGLVRPGIVLPTHITLRMDNAQLQAILVHEMAHIVRRDPWVGLAQRIAALVFWWNPLVHWVSDQTSSLREDLCDNYVVRVQGNGEDFARTLVDVASQMTARPVLPATVGVLEPSLDGLTERIRRLVGKERNMATQMSVGSMLLVLTCTLAILFGTGLIRCLQAAEVAPAALAGAGTEADVARPPATPAAASAVVEPKTGLRFTVAKAFEGENDHISVVDKLVLSPNGRFLHWQGMVVPVDGAAPFQLLDRSVQDESYSPDGKWIAFIGKDGLYAVPVALNEGKPSGPAKKLITVIPASGRGRPLVWSRDSQHIVFKDPQGVTRAVSVRDGVTSEWSGSLGILSPDGSTVAFSAWGDGIWVQPASGAGPARCLSSPDDLRTTCEPVAWSADGQWIIGQAIGYDPNARRVHGLRFAHVTSGRQHVVPVPDEVGTFVGKADTGRELYFYRPSYEVEYAPRIASPAGRGFKPVTLARPPGVPSECQWSPDSATLTAITWDSEDKHIRCWLLPLSGDAPRELKLEAPELTDIEPLVFDRSCRQLLLCATDKNGEFSYFVAQVSLEQGKTLGPAHRLCPFGSRPNPIWSPDGSRLVVEKEGQLWLVSPDGKEWSEVSPKIGAPNSPSWSPDGSYLAFVTFPSTKATLHVVPAKGGERRTLYTWPGKQHKWDWTADGKSITVVSDGVVHKVPITGGQGEEILNLKALGYGDVDWLGWSPDGQWLAFYATGSAKERDELFVMGAQERTSRKVATEDRWPTRWSFGWSPDSRHIAYQYEDRVKKRPAGVLYRLDTDEALKRVVEGAVPATPIAKREPNAINTPAQTEPIPGPVFTDNFDSGPSKHWLFQDSPEMGLGPGRHAVENGELMLSHARACLYGIDWTDYVVTVRVCMKESVASGEAVFGITARETPSQFGSSRKDRYSLLCLYVNNTPRYLLLDLNYADASDTLRLGRLSQSPCSLVRDKWYTLAFEIRGQHLRGYLDGKLVIEATDARLSKGGVMLNTYKARALFDDFSVRQLP